jgi:flagellar basal-body rod modification protein FlgD
MQVTSSQSPDPASALEVTSSTSSRPSNKLASQDVFLQLMVAQIRNQDPLQPADSAQFMGQLAQFSQLEQLVQIRTEIAQLNSYAAASSTDGNEAV